MTFYEMLLILSVCTSNFSHHERPLLLSSLEAAVAEFGGGVDEFELDGLVRLARCVHEQRLCGGIHKDVHTSHELEALFSALTVN